MWTLDKVSSPGWEKQYRTRREAVAVLAKQYICGPCMKGIDGIVDSRAKGGVRWEKRNKPPNPKSMIDLLSTPCGLEFEIYKTKKGPARRFVKVKKKEPLVPGITTDPGQHAALK